MPIVTVLGEELAYIEAARSGAAPPTRTTAAPGTTAPPLDTEPLPFDDETNRDRKCAATKQLFGLAFSGGGIRSATFNLGVLQALAELGVLAKVDYLSTVSGGGYIGSWFT